MLGLVVGLFNCLGSGVLGEGRGHVVEIFGKVEIAVNAALFERLLALLVGFQSALVIAILAEHLLDGGASTA